MNYKPAARKSDIVTQDSLTETLIYDLKTNKAFCLNETSALVWQLSDGRNSVSEISDAMSVQLKTLVSEDLVWLAVDQLSKDGLLEKGDAIKNHFSGLSRREAIRKVGFASVVALPIISSLIAPSASMAQSICLALNSPCSPTPCCSGNCVSVPNPATCCVPGAFNNATAGFFTTCVTDQSDCDVSAGIVCCSGTGTRGSQGICPAGQVECICD